MKIPEALKGMVSQLLEDLIELLVVAVVAMVVVGVVGVMVVVVMGARDRPTHQPNPDLSIQKTELM